MPADLQKAREIFLHVVGTLPPDQWEDYVGQACGREADLEQEVKRLLKTHRDAGSFLDRPAAALGGTGGFTQEPGVEVKLTLAESVGAVIGPYKLLQKIGEGGMGVVWLAEQTQPVQRKVALKVIKPGMDSSQVIARFEAERQALAMMDHVNIARVFDGGTTENGRPYFVMELVHGVPITKYCDDNHLTPRERLELFVPVCQAIQHAHQKGIIHRDIKPSNVMVTLYDGKPVPKVIDFGVAKATEQKLTERTLFTQYGTMVGTLEYMSPEQAEMSALGVDTRSDIYSLGVLLYELLMGNTPLTHKTMKEAAYAEILRMIKEVEPPKPSTRLSDSGEALASISANRHMDPAKLTKLVRGELDWIVMKTLEKDRTRRYETANGFAMDVQRYLADEAVHACPASVGYRFRKFARRNKRALVTAGLLSAMLLILAVGLGWVASDRATLRARTAGEVNQYIERAESLYADNKLPEAMGEVQKARGVLEAGSGDEELGRRVRQWLTDLETAAKLEEIRLESYDQKDRDRAYADFAQVFRDYGIDVETLPAEDVTARVAVSQIKLDLVLALRNWADRLRVDPRPQDPARWHRLPAVSRAADPDPWRLRLDGAVEGKDLQTLRELANGADPSRMRTRTLAYLGDSLRAAGDAKAAVTFLSKAQRQHPGDFSINSNLALCLSELKPPPLDEVIAFRRAALAARPQSAWAHCVLGIALGRKDRLDEAIAEHREAIRLRPGYVHAHNSLGIALQEQNKLDEAIAEFREAIRLKPDDFYIHRNLGRTLEQRHEREGHKDKGLLDEAIAEYREAIRLKPDDPLSWLVLGDALREAGRLDEAAAACQESIRLQPKRARGHAGLARVLCAQKLLDEALEEARTAVRLEPVDAEAHHTLGRVYTARTDLAGAVAADEEAVRLSHPVKSARYSSILAVSYHAVGRYADALKLCEETLALRKAKLGPDHPDTLKSMSNLAACYGALGRHAEALKLCEETLALQKAKLGPNHPDTLRSMNNLAAKYHALGRHTDALKLCQETLALRKAKLGPDHADTLSSMGSLAACYGALGRHAEALKLYEETLALQKANLSPDHPDTLKSMHSLAVSYRRLGRHADALKLSEETLALRKAKLGPDHPETLRSMMGLVNSYAALGRHPEAVKLGEQTLALQKTKLPADHPDTLQSMHNLVNSYAALWQHADGLEYAKKAVELQPRSAYAWQALGWAHYRAGAWLESIETLEKSCELNKRGTGDYAQWIVLALAHAKLAAQEGLPEQDRTHHQTEARRWFEKADKQIDSRWRARPGDVFGQAVWDFRAEARKLMGAKEIKK